MRTHPMTRSHASRRPRRRAQVTPPAALPRDLADRTARDLMTENPTTIDERTTLREAAEKLSTMDIRHLPVVRGSSVVGMLSDRDLHATLWTEGTLEAERWRLPVSAAMNTNVISTTPEASLSEVVDQLLENRIGAVPVIEEHQDELLGIVSYVDVLRALRDATK